MVARSKYRIEGEDATGAAFKSVLGNANKTASKMSAAFKTAFAGVGVAAFVGLGREAIGAGDDLEKFRVRARLSAKEASSLAYAAKQSDVGLEGLGKSLQKMQVFLSKAETGEKTNVQALQALGVELDSIKDLRSDQQFEMIGDAISQLRSEEDQARASTEIFGKAGGELQPMFSKGAAGIREARQEAEKLGLTFDDVQLKKLSETDDAVKRLDSSFEHFKQTLMATAADNGLTDWLNRLSGVIPLEQRIREAQFNVDNPNFFESDATRAANRQELDRLIAERELTGNLHPELGGRGVRGKGSNAGPGYAASAAAEEAATAAKAAGDAEFKEEERLAKEREELFADTDQKIADAHFESLEEQWTAQMEFDKQLTDAQLENAKQLDEWHEEQAHKISENAQIFKDAFMNAWDDMVNTGKFKWDELLKYMLAEFARRGISNIFDSIFAGGGAGGAGGGGLMAGGGVWKWLGDVFGGIFKGGGGGIDGRASGGSVSAGKSYLVGERGMELFTPAVSGAITPNHVLSRGGGNVTISAHYNIDARGADASLTKALPGIFKRNNEALKLDIIQGIRSGRYPTG